MLSVTTLCTVCALSFIAVPPKGEESSSEAGKCPVTGLLTSSKTKAAEAAIPAEVGKMAPPFELMDTNGKAHKLSDFKGKTVVLEWFCARCPYSGKASGRSVHSTGKVKKLMEDLKKVDENIVYLLIDSSSKWSKEDVIKEAKACAEAMDIKAPMLIDHGGKVGKDYGARTTPHMYVIDAEGKLRYDGAFSEQAGRENFVLNAVKAIKKGEDPKPSKTRSWGCGVKY